MIRITLGTMPSLLREIVASTLANEPDFEVTAIAREAADAGFDVLLLCSGTGDEARIALGELLRRNPPAIIALDANGEKAAILRLDCHEEQLSSPGDLCGVVRQAALGLQGTRH